MNVVYDSTESFDERAAALTKRDLDAGVKSGQRFYTNLITKYNSTDTDLYDENLFPSDVSSIVDPSIFEVYETAEWRAFRVI